MKVHSRSILRNSCRLFRTERDRETHQTIIRLFNKNTGAIETQTSKVWTPINTLKIFKIIYLRFCGFLLQHRLRFWTNQLLIEANFCTDLSNIFGSIDFGRGFVPEKFWSANTESTSHFTHELNEKWNEVCYSTEMIRKRRKLLANISFSVLVDASDMCNTLNFQIGVNGMGTTIVSTRSWNIKVIFVRSKCSKGRLI